MEDFLVDNGNRRGYRGRVSLFWVNFITTSRRDRNLESWWIYKGNHPQMAARFRLVTYYILPRYVCILGLTHMYAYTYMCMHICISVYMGLYSVLWLMDDVCIYIYTHTIYIYTCRDWTNILDCLNHNNFAGHGKPVLTRAGRDGRGSVRKKASLSHLDMLEWFAHLVFFSGSGKLNI